MKLTKAQRVWISGILVAVAFILKNTIGEQIITSVVMILAAIIAGTPILRNAISAARYWIIGIDALVSIAVIGAMFIGEYWEAAAVTFLFMLGDYLESRTIEKTRSSIKALLDLAPDTARVMRDGVEIIISPDEVVKGDQVVVKPGEKISVDGNVIEGSAYVNQSAITGESIPVNRNIDDSVFSGTIIESGYLVIEATRVGEDTTFARILQMVEEAQDKKAKTQKFLEKFSRYYTPAIIVLAIGLYLVTQDLVLALTLLVIACPGALVISTPVSIVAGIGNGAKHGVLVKGGEIMENLGKIKVLAFDKTGTLTVGKPMVTHIKSYNIDEKELLRITAIGEGYSEHPLARAILARAEKDLGKIDEMPEESEIITGQGLKTKIEGGTILIGNRKLFLENKISIGEDVEKYLQSEEEKGQTAVIVGDTRQVLGVISIADVVREDAEKLVSNLKRLGVEKIVMLTGDNRRAAKAIAEEIGLDDFYAELLPEDKVRVLKELQEKYGVAAMVGDGVNDAPALASADLGIAIGGAGTDVAMETADVVLMSDEIKKLSHAIGLSRATVNNMRQNIYFAIAVAALLLAGVLIKTVNLSFGMLVHELSVLLVVINAVRLLGYGDRGKSKKMLEI
ncbi:cadmium-translocating P-type ATPase [Tissierella carlieri]|uniref:Cd(2+)-exporting ATPase n=1 Tax=Tissierella carlieri TaxID=689904 RepID=A0ABT1SG45_9FIRM|nr:cation-translocating P-type ATPase [Tissierella carlieri]MBU5312963.1 cadmium-translocating P-type ATPase [Tissierella carlieri]MCQ4925459.1 cation-translocating P-type ATPase [Tissierella carlieri]